MNSLALLSGIPALVSIRETAVVDKADSRIDPANYR
jgi:hypothetical protein